MKKHVVIAGLIFDCRQQNPVSVHVMRIRFNKCNCKNTIFFIYYNTEAKSVIKQLKLTMHRRGRISVSRKNLN